MEARLEGNLPVREMSGGEAVTETLLAHGVNTVYGLPGVQSDHLFSAFHDAGEKLRVIHSRHEQGVAYMALGAALATGRPQAFSVVPGPGFLNACAALSTAYAVNAPVLALVGQIPSHGIGGARGLLHEIPDQSGVLRGLTKWSGLARDPQGCTDMAAQALSAIATGRPRPAGVELPQDVLGARAPVTLSGPMLPQPAAEPDGNAIERAAQLLARAERPLIVVGSGAIGAGDQIRLLAERLGAPVFSNRLGRGILDDRHDLAHVLPGGHALWRNADVVLAVGSRMQQSIDGWGVDERLKIIRIDIDPDEMARYGAPEVGLAGDAGRCLSLLLEQVKRHPDATRRRADSRVLKDRIADEIAAGVAPQVGYLRAIRDVLPDDGVLVDELTQVGYVARYGYEVRRPRTLLTAGYQGTLGWGVPTALGAKDALGSVPVVSIAGDGGFMFSSNELASAVRHKIAAVFVVFNDNAFGNVRRIQQMSYGNRVIASDLSNPDFVRFAESFGVAAERVREPEAFKAALEKALARGTPGLIEVPFASMPTPWRFIHMPRVRGPGAV